MIVVASGSLYVPPRHEIRSLDRRALVVGVRNIKTQLSHLGPGPSWWWSMHPVFQGNLHEAHHDKNEQDRQRRKDKWRQKHAQRNLELVVV
jgi:hypothetical protein